MKKLCEKIIKNIYRFIYPDLNRENILFKKNAFVNCRYKIFFKLTSK